MLINGQVEPDQTGPTVAPGVAPAALRMFENDRAPAALRIHILTLVPGHAVTTMRVREDMLNGFSIAHGGFVFTLADTAFAEGCNEDQPVTVASGAEISYLRPARTVELLAAAAHRRQLSGRSGIYDVQVSNETEVIAEFRGRSRITSMSPTETVSPVGSASPAESISSAEEGA